MRPSERRRRLSLGLLLCGLLLGAGPAQAFDLDSLTRQLAAPAVVRGEFLQEKQLRGLPQPLVSRGRFVLARGQGLLWQLRAPLALDYRITPAGISQRSDGTWQAPSGGALASRQQQLLLAVMAGDVGALSADFTPTLSGGPEAWTLELTPKGGLLQQIFAGIRIEGNALVERIEVAESQGDRTRITLSASMADRQLSDGERQDLAP